MLKGFRDFILRGNVVDLAVAVVIGTAFGAVVTAFGTGRTPRLDGAVRQVPDLLQSVQVETHSGRVQALIGMSLPRTRAGSCCRA